MAVIVGSRRIVVGTRYPWLWRLHGLVREWAPVRELRYRLSAPARLRAVEARLLAAEGIIDTMERQASNEKNRIWEDHLLGQHDQPATRRYLQGKADASRVALSYVRQALKGLAR